MFGGIAAGTQPTLDDVQGYFESYWNLETGQKPIRFGERDTKASLLDLASRMLAVLYREREPEMEIVGVEQAFDVPLIDLDTGEVLDRALVGTLDLLERDAAGGLVVVDLKTSARKYSDLQVEASLQLSVYSYVATLCDPAVNRKVLATWGWPAEGQAPVPPRPSLAASRPDLILGVRRPPSCLCREASFLLIQAFHLSLDGGGVRA